MSFKFNYNSLFKTIGVFLCLTLITSTCAAETNGIKERLNEALSLDQKHRQAIQLLEQKAVTNNSDKSELNRLNALQKALDIKNIVTLKDIIQQLGHWPGMDDVGENVAKMALIIAKHASIDQQIEFLPLIKKATLNKQIKPEWFAFLYDQHLMKQGLPQAYGTLMLEGNKLYPMQPLAQVNKNRSEVALSNLNQALAEKSLWLRPNLLDKNHFELVNVAVFEQFAELALACLDKEYPNSIKHVLQSDTDALTPSQMHPAFFGCFDWHSSVHGHWLLVKALKTFPDHPAFQKIKPRLAAHFTQANIQKELAYFQQEGRNSYERPYGMAWYLQLVSELHDWHEPEAQQWRQNLQPLEQEIKTKLKQWIPKLTHPIRNGTHSQTAFSFGLMLDYAEQVGDLNFQVFLQNHISRFYLKDKKCPINYEPSGHDFLSACLAEADLMRRVFLKPKAYQKWLKKFLPQIKHGSDWLAVAVSTDPSDGHLSHMDGLNISRAWMLEGMASTMPINDKRRALLLRQANNHRQAGLAAVTGEHYAGGHWLGSFAMYYLTQSGLRK